MVLGPISLGNFCFLFLFLSLLSMEVLLSIILARSARTDSTSLFVELVMVDETDGDGSCVLA